MMPLRFELSPDQKRVEHLIEAVGRLQPLEWSSSERVRLSVGNDHFEVDAKASWNNGICKATLVDVPVDVYVALTTEREYGTMLGSEEMVRLSALDDSWTLSNVSLTKQERMLGDLTANIIQLEGWELRRGDETPRAPARIIVFSGVALRDYPQVFPIGKNGEGASVDGFITTIFDRPALVRRLSFNDRHDAPYTAVAYEGAPLDEEQRKALWLVLSFVAGTLGHPEATYDVDGDGSLLGSRFAAASDRPQRTFPPVNWMRFEGAVQDLPSALTPMLDAAVQLARDDIHLDVALTHLFEASSYLDLEIRDIVSALDALVESSAFAANGTTLVKPPAYATLLAKLNPIVHELVRSEGLDTMLASRIIERLKGANDISHGKRRNKFWRRVGFTLSEREKDALNNRHPMSHRGFVTKGGNLPALIKLGEDVRVARTLVNRVIFSLLTYDGPIFDFLIGKNVNIPRTHDSHPEQ